MLVSQRPLSALLLTLQFGDERLTVSACVAPLARGLVAIACGSLAVLRGLRALLGGLRASLRGAPSLCGSADDPIAAGESARLILWLGRGFAPLHSEIARLGSVVSRPRGTITSVGDLVPLRSGVQTRLGGFVAPEGGRVALAGCALADVMAGVVLFAVTAGREVLIAGGLIAIGSQLVAIGARLIGIRQGLLTIRQRLIALERPRRRNSVLPSRARPVRGAIP